MLNENLVNVDETENLSDDAELETSDQSSSEVSEPTDESEAVGLKDGDEEITVSIGDEKPQEAVGEVAQPWVREVRKINRELTKQNKELKAKLDSLVQAPAIEPIKKPTLEDCDYEQDKYEAKIIAWHEQQRKVEAEKEMRRKAEEAQTQEWQAKVAGYNKGAQELKVRDYPEAEHAVREALNQTQLGIIVSEADNANLVVYALYKNTKKLSELKEIKNPLKFAKELGKLETQLKVQKKAAPPPPERAVESSRGKVAAQSNARLEKIEADAVRTRDLTELVAYRRRNNIK